ncbi:MAG: hypothetical protein ACRDD7_01390 [Peptostreptococcaceae bacterium]
MDKIEMVYRLQKIETMLHSYSTIDNDINLICCMEEVLKILRGLVDDK